MYCKWSTAFKYCFFISIIYCCTLSCVVGTVIVALTCMYHCSHINLTLLLKFWIWSLYYNHMFLLIYHLFQLDFFSKFRWLTFCITKYFFSIRFWINLWWSFWGSCNFIKNFISNYITSCFCCFLNCLFWNSFKCICSKLFSMVKKFLTIFTT